ncbi:MAG: biotin transport system substrate-specific component [Saprospiraceae bacterium]|jgi:biotin transport system substrate-specific component
MKKIFTETAVILAAVFFIALSAQITIEVPLNDARIPISGQSFAVLLVAGILGLKRSVEAVALYVLLGTLGLPIFADGASGLDVLMGGSGGFLIGFIFAAFGVGYRISKPLFRPISFVKSLYLMTFGTAIILFFGIGRLTMLYGFEKALEYGFYPFWQGALVKILFGAIVLFVVEKVRENLMSNI